MPDQEKKRIRWEERFDEKFHPFIGYRTIGPKVFDVENGSGVIYQLEHLNPKEVKSFISEELANERKRVVELANKLDVKTIKYSDGSIDEPYISKNNLIALINRHPRLTGIYNEPPKWREVPMVALVFGIPFALIFALIYSLF